MPQLTDRSKLPDIVDPVIRNTMDPKHLFQVHKYFPFLLDLFLPPLQLEGLLCNFILSNGAGCCCRCTVCATGTELSSPNNRCFALSYSSCSCWAWRDSQIINITSSCGSSLAIVWWEKVRKRNVRWNKARKRNIWWYCSTGSRVLQCSNIRFFQSYLVLFRQIWLQWMIWKPIAIGAWFKALWGLVECYTTYISFILKNNKNV